MEVDQYLSNVFRSGEYARPNQFEVFVFPPAKIIADGFFMERVSMNCRSAALPGRSIDTKPHDQGGFVARKMAHSQQYQDLPLTFYLSRDLAEKRLFDAWQDLLFDPVFQNLAYYEDYVGGLTVRQLNRDDTVSQAYNFLECWPISVGDVDLAMDTNDSVEVLSVTMAFRHWEIERTEER